MKLHIAKAAVNQCSLPSSDVKAMSLYCPSLPEQRKIADLLSAVDNVIAAQEAEAAAWEKRKKGVMQKLFSQEVRFKADDGSELPGVGREDSGRLRSLYGTVTHLRAIHMFHTGNIV